MALNENTPAISIVVAEDDPDDQLLLKEAFRKAKVPNALTITNDGVELMEHLARCCGQRQHPRPDLVILDLNMPRMDGREALAEIKSNPDLRSIPVVVLTTSADEGDVSQCYTLGANSYIRKPASFDDLVDIVSHIGRYWLELVELPPHSA